MNWSQSRDTLVVRPMRVLIQDETCVAFQCKGSDTVASLKYAIQKELGMTHARGFPQLLQWCLLPENLRPNSCKENGSTDVGVMCL